MRAFDTRSYFFPLRLIHNRDLDTLGSKCYDEVSEPHCCYLTCVRCAVPCLILRDHFFKNSSYKASMLFLNEAIRYEEYIVWLTITAILERNMKRVCFFILSRIIKVQASDRSE